MSSSLPSTRQEPLQTIISVPPAPSAPSAPTAPSVPSAPPLSSLPTPRASHPASATSLQQAATVEAARVCPAGTTPTGTNPPRPAPTQRSPAVAPVPVNFHVSCSNPTCIAASRRIKDVRFVQDTFARINANYATNYGIAEPIRAALNAAYKVLLDCECRTIMARVGSVATMMRQANGRPTNNQDVLMHLLRLTGMQILTIPRAAASVPATMGTPQCQSVHAGGGSMSAGAAMPSSAGHTPAAGHAPAAVHTSAPAPAPVYAPAAAYMRQAGGTTAGTNVA